jgi:hypothetical protein
MTKLYIGDKLKCISWWEDLKVGKIYEITEISFNPPEYNTRYTFKLKGLKGMGWGDCTLNFLFKKLPLPLSNKIKALRILLND